jgi:hypothetical protein
VVLSQLNNYAPNNTVQLFLSTYASAVDEPGQGTFTYTLTNSASVTETIMLECLVLDK